MYAAFAGRLGKATGRSANRTGWRPARRVRAAVCRARTVLDSGDGMPLPRRPMHQSGRVHGQSRQGMNVASWEGIRPEDKPEQAAATSVYEDGRAGGQAELILGRSKKHHVEVCATRLNTGAKQGDSAVATWPRLAFIDDSVFPRLAIDTRAACGIS